MRIGSLRRDGGNTLALIHGEDAVAVEDLCTALGRDGESDQVLALAADLGSVLTLGRWSEGWESRLGALDAELPRLIAADKVRTHRVDDLDAPLRRPGKILCIGRNYAEHARELGHDLPGEPIVFTKHQTSITGPFADIVRPAEVADMDYEAELAVIIGRRVRDISRDAAGDAIAGYCCANDVSARTAQMATGQWVRGKSFDSFCPLGPYVVTADAVPDPQQLGIRCRVDGTVMQDSETSLMLFPIDVLIEHCSRGTTLEPGDIILTGTPPGVAMGRTPPAWLEPGQLCEVEIDGIGRIANRIAAP